MNDTKIGAKWKSPSQPDISDWLCASLSEGNVRPIRELNLFLKVTGGYV